MKQEALLALEELNWKRSVMANVGDATEQPELSCVASESITVQTFWKSLVVC